ncbi:hypothetical protein GFY24_32910 [Nocardia sp. SYP-A9097]|nr:hypothetical protein [Nocardia sp. SYP-A9097]
MVDADLREEPERYRHGAAVQVVAKLYLDELADRLDWDRFVAEFPGAFQPGRSTDPVGYKTDVRSASARGRNSGPPGRQRMLAAVLEVVVVD